jgi:non-homologous end joining protein Ku
MIVNDSLVEVGRSPIRKDTGAVIESYDVIRHAQADTGEWVILTDDEIVDCTSPKGVGEIVSFVPVKSVGEYLAENQSQVRPKAEKGKENPAAAKAFALLMATMKANKVVALIKVALRGPARYGLLDSTGTFTLVYTADAVRQPRPVTEYTFSKAELDMAKALVEAVGIDTPVITDDTAPVVQEFVNSKATGVIFVPASTPEPTIDLAAALMASVEAAKAAKAPKAKGKKVA